MIYWKIKQHISLKFLVKEKKISYELFINVKEDVWWYNTQMDAIHVILNVRNDLLKNGKRLDVINVQVDMWPLVLKETTNKDRRQSIRMIGDMVQSNEETARKILYDELNMINFVQTWSRRIWLRKKMIIGLKYTLTSWKGLVNNPT